MHSLPVPRSRFAVATMVDRYVAVYRSVLAAREVLEEGRVLRPDR